MSIYVVINFYSAVKTANCTKHAISNTEMLFVTFKQSIFKAGSDCRSFDQKTKTSMMLMRLI